MNKRELMMGTAIMPAIALPLTYDRVTFCRTFHKVKNLGSICSNSGRELAICETCETWLCCDDG